MLTLEPQETIYVGDNLYAYIQGSEKDDLLPVLVDPRDLYPENPWTTIQSIDERLELLEIKVSAGYMEKRERLRREFYEGDTKQVARELLGCRLVKLEKHDGKIKRISGIITETEAYCGESDLGCHAKAGRTPRTEVLYGPAGMSYVYFTYGNHWLFCAVTRPEGQPEAILIRAIEVDEGLVSVEQRRGHIARKHWTDGPGNLTQALAIQGQHNKADLCESKAIIFIESGPGIPESQVTRGPRIGLYTVPEPWKSKPWRYLADRKLN